MKEVGRVKVRYTTKPSLLMITEQEGFIHMNGKYLPVSHNVEDSFRWILKLEKELHIKITHFATEPVSSKFTKSTFLKSYWEEISADSINVTVTIVISNMTDDASEPDSVS
jgi:hypothetical protein